MQKIEIILILQNLKQDQKLNNFESVSLNEM
jgi:hypothetical protein